MQSYRLTFYTQSLQHSSLIPFAGRESPSNAPDNYAVRLPLSDHGLCQHFSACKETISLPRPTGGGRPVAGERADYNGEPELEISPPLKALDADHLGGKYRDEGKERGPDTG